MTGRTVHLDGKPVTLAELPLKGGGQAAVFPVEGDDTIVVKLYRDRPGPDLSAAWPACSRCPPGRPPHGRQPAPRTGLAHRHGP